MSRISIDVTDDEHKKLKAVAALRGKSIKDYVLERTLGADVSDDASLRELEKLLDGRIHAAKAGAISRRTAASVFAKVAREKAN
jgi:hypothetical protein